MKKKINFALGLLGFLSLLIAPGFIDTNPLMSFGCIVITACTYLLTREVENEEANHTNQ